MGEEFFLNEGKIARVNTNGLIHKIHDHFTNITIKRTTMSKNK